MSEGFVFNVSIQRIGDMAGDRLHLMPIYASFPDEGEATEAVKSFLGGMLEGTRIDNIHPMPSGVLINPREVKQA